MIRSKGILPAAHILALGIIVVLSLSIITYPIGFLASADIASGSLTGPQSTSNKTLFNVGVDDGTAIPDGTGSAQPVVESSPNAVPSSDSSSSPPDSSADSSGSTPTSDSSSSPPDSSADSSSDGTTTTSGTSGGGSTVAAGSTRNDSSTSPDLGTPTSDSNAPPLPTDSSTTTDSSSEGSTTTTDSSGASPTEGTVSTGNDSAIAEVNEGSGSVDTTGAVGNDTSSVSDTSGGSPAAEAAVSDQSSGLPANGNLVQTQEPNSLSTADSSTESITSASAENPNAVVQPISAGDGQTVTLGDVSNSDGTSAKLSLENPPPQGYQAGDSAEISLQDSDANVDPKVINTVQIIVGQSREDPSGQSITLTETAPDSGKFTGAFTVSGDQSKNHIFYDTGHPRGSATFNGVTQPGSVEVQELPVSSFGTVLGADNAFPGEPVGSGLQVSLADGAQVDPSSGMTVSLSFANVNLNGQFPDALDVWQFSPDTGWVDLRDYSGPPLLEGTTITTNSPFPCTSMCVFLLGPPGSGSGGGGGGAGLPGAGLILDLVAPLVDENSGSPGTSEPVSSNGPDTTVANTLSLTDNSGSTAVPSSAVPVSTTTSNNVSSTQESGKTTEVSQNTGSATVSSSGIATIAVPGAGNVVVSFTKLVSDPTITVSAVKTPSELSALHIATGENGQGTLTSLDNTRYSIAGNVFVVGPLDTKFDGTATVTVPYDAKLAPQASEVKLLYYTGSSWEDVTTNPPADGHVVTGGLTTFGPVVPAIKAQ